MKKEFSVIYYSSDAYQDCWKPFFDLWSRYFKTKMDYEVLLLNNSLDYDHDTVDIEIVSCGLEAPWSKRLRMGIERAQSDIIFLIGDDFFPLSRVHCDLMESQFDLMRKNLEIDHIRYLYKPGKFKTRASNWNDLDEIERFTKYRFLFAPSFWRKDSLLRYIVDFESPFMSEKMGTYKSWILNHGMYCVSDSYIKKNGRPFDCGSSGVIVKGKWAEWAVPRLQEEDLGIDFFHTRNPQGRREKSGDEAGQNRSVEESGRYDSILLLSHKVIASTGKMKIVIVAWDDGLKEKFGASAIKSVERFNIEEISCQLLSFFDEGGQKYSKHKLNII